MQLISTLKNKVISFLRNRVNMNEFKCAKYEAKRLLIDLMQKPVNEFMPKSMKMSRSLRIENANHAMEDNDIESYLKWLTR